MKNLELFQGLLPIVIKSRVDNHIENCLGRLNHSEFVMTKMCVVGSRLKGTHRPDSDLDIALAYKGSLSEDDCFNMLMAEPLSYKGVKFDFIPYSEEIGNKIYLEERYYSLYSQEDDEEFNALEFLADKMMRLVEKDALLKFTFNDLSKKMPKEEVLQVLFNGYVLDDSVMEQQYLKA